MRLLVIWKRLSIGGINSGWRTRAAYFAKHGITTEFLYFTDAGGGRLMEPAATYYLVNNDEEAVKIIKNRKYDCVIIVDFKETYPILKQADFKGTTILESRVPVEGYVRKQLRDFTGIEPIAIVTPSEYQKELASSSDHQIPIYVIPNSIDSNFFAPVLDEITLHASDPPLPPNKKIIGWIGNLVDQQKRWKFLLKTFRKLHKNRQDVHLWVIGGHSSKETDLFQETIKRLRLSNSVSWFPAVSYEQLPLIYSKIAYSGGCLFSTTKRESFGNIFTEAMSIGCPIVAPHITAVPEVVTDGKTGLLYNPTHKLAALHAINIVLDDSGIREHLIQQAKDDVVQRFSTEVSAKKYVDFLKENVQVEGS